MNKLYFQYRFEYKNKLEGLSHSGQTSINVPDTLMSCPEIIQQLAKNHVLSLITKYRENELNDIKRISCYGFKIETYFKEFEFNTTDIK